MHSGSLSEFTTNIYRLGFSNQRLIHKCLNLGFVKQASELRHLDTLLMQMLCKSQHLNFVNAIAQGRTLLVGEGNLSFALSLVRDPRISTNRFVATTYELQDALTEEAENNARTLKALGATVLFGVDATVLQASFGSWRFDTIVFQFPHTGNREAVEGRSSNFILLREFLLSAASQLQVGGQVFVTAVDSPHYRGAFQFEEAAKIAGFLPPTIYPFDARDFPGYEHTMTHQSGSALEGHDNFSTWVFRK